MSNLGPISTALEGEHAMLMGAGPRSGWRIGSGCMNPTPLHSRLKALSRRLSEHSGPELAEYFHLEGRRHAR
jgi:hypothetical protein